MTDTYPCAYCGTMFAINTYQRGHLEHGRAIYCAPQCAIRAHADKRYAHAPQIAHCGIWHAITALPMRCPLCAQSILVIKHSQ